MWIGLIFIMAIMLIEAAFELWSSKNGYYEPDEIVLVISEEGMD